MRAPLASIVGSLGSKEALLVPLEKADNEITFHVLRQRHRGIDLSALCCVLVS